MEEIGTWLGREPDTGEDVTQAGPYEWGLGFMWKNSSEEDGRASQPKAKMWIGALWRGRKSKIRVSGSLGHVEGGDLAGEVAAVCSWGHLEAAPHARTQP